MPGPFIFNNRFLGKNKQNWEDSYFDYMNTSNAVGNYPTYSKKEYAKDIRNRNKKEAYNNNVFGNPLSPVQYQTPFNAGNLSPIRTTAPAYNFDIEEWENNQQNNFRDSVQDMARDMSDNFEQEEFDPIEAEAMNSWNVQKDEDGNILGSVAANRDNGQFGGTAWDWKFKVKDENGNVIGEKDRSGLGKGLGMGLAVAGQVGDSLLNNSYKGNQGAYVSGAFGKNQMLDNVNNIRTAINSTDFNDVMQQYKGINNQLNSQRTKRLSNGQIGGMAGVGAAKGAAAGTAFGPWGTVIGGAVGGIVGLGKGIMTNNHISEVNQRLDDKATEINNYMNNAMFNIRLRNSRNKGKSAFNTFDYGGALQDPYGINYFGEGNSHENNRFGGVPVSIAEDGKPNLVEEGEVIYDDYVYSDRINISDSTRKQLNLKNNVKTFANAAKSIQEKGKERPNDPVMEQTIKVQMQKLKSKQEEVKERKEQREQEKVLAQMSDQERQMLEQQQMEQQANAYEQQMVAEQQAQMAQQMPQEGTQQEQMAMQEQQPAMSYAEGGKLKGGTNNIDSHKFAGDRWKDYDWSNFDFSKIFNDDTYQYINRRNNKAFDFGANKADEETKKAYDLVFNNDNEYTDDYNNLISSLKGMSDDNKAKFLEGYKNLWKKYHGTDFTGDFNEAMTKLEDKKWGNAHAAMSKILKEKSAEEPVEEPKPVDIQQEELDRPIYNWRYRPNWIPGAIDLGLLAQAYAPADYSRARSIENTPIREVQYNPNGQYVNPYIIDARPQYMMNYDNAQATNRAIQNNSGGNGANAVAAMIANNAAANQAAAQLNYQADKQNADSIYNSIAFNNAVDAQNAQGFLSASEANQRADTQRGEFNMRGKLLREQIDAQRGQAISNSWGAVADDFNNYYNDRYNRGMIAGLAESGYFGEMPEDSLLRKNIGFNIVGRESVNGRNYIEDENGIHYLTPNGVDYNIDGINDVYLKNINGKYYKTNRV